MAKIWNQSRPKSHATNWNGKDLDPSVGDVHPHNRSDSQKMVQGGAGSRHLDYYGPKHSAAAVKGAHWAKPDKGKDEDDSFRHTNGCYTNPHTAAGPFAKAVNMSGGVTQHEPFGATHTDSGRPAIHDFRQLYKEQKQGAGNTFQEQRRKARS